MNRGTGLWKRKNNDSGRGGYSIVLLMGRHDTTPWWVFDTVHNKVVYYLRQPGNFGSPTLLPKRRRILTIAEFPRMQIFGSAI